MSHRHPVVAALCLAAALVLAGCSGSDAPDTAQVLEGEASDPSAGAGEPDSADDVAQPSAGSDEDGRTVEVASDGTILIRGDQASFVMPSGNIQCVMRAASVVCQIADKDFEPADDDLDPEALGDCGADSADAVTVLSGSRATWGCTSETIRGQAALELGGWWAADGVGTTEQIEGTDLAVLAYDSSLQVGSMLCRSSFTDVTCRDLDSSHGFTLAREAYSTS
jgi:hypothetical protein